MKKTLNEWIEDLKGRFDERELKYQSVHKAKIQLQLKDAETGEIHLHEIEYKAKEANNIKEAKEIVKEIFSEEFNFRPNNKEIKNIPKK